MDREQPPAILVRIEDMSRWAPLLVAAAGLVLLIASSAQRTPWLIWNASPSVATGLYAVSAAPLRRGDIAVVRLPAPIAEIAHRRRYLPRSVDLLKPVAAVAGDRICRIGRRVFIGGVFAATAQSQDVRGRPLPSWQGCRVLAQDEVLLLARPLNSFDGRYFGPLRDEHVIGRAHQLSIVREPSR